MKIKDICKYGKKSKIKAGDGLEKGEFRFFTSSSVCNKYLDFAQFEDPGIIMGTGGNATLHYAEGDFSVSTDCVVLLPDSNVNCKYLYYYLKKNMRILEAGFKGAGLKHTSKKYIDEIDVIDIPDKSLQLEIVKTLDKVVSIIDNRLIQLNELDMLIKSQFVAMFGNIKEEVPLSYYISALTAGKSLAGMEDCEYKVLKTGAVTYDYFDETQVKNLPSDYEPNDEHLVHSGDVLISRMNTAELVGAAAYVWNAPDKTYLPDRLWRAEIKDTIVPIFLWQLLIQPSTKGEIRKRASGTSGSMKNISKPNLLGIQVKKVEITLQQEFIAFVQQVDKLKIEIQKSLDETQTLFDSLMQEYFG